MNLKFLKDFHRRRVQILAESGADLLAFETVPNKLEAQVVVMFIVDFLFIVHHLFSLSSYESLS